LTTQREYEKVDLDTVKFTLELPPRSNQQFEYVLRTPVKIKAPRVYAVRRGDTLSNIARKYYGSADQWRKILEANRSQIRDPDRLRTGTRLTIP
jgi:nucleoid-associated protein YgaU